MANPGYLFSQAAIPRGAVIVEVDGKPVNSLDDFEAALDELADGERTLVRFVNMENPQNSIVRLLEMDRVWFPAQRCARDDQLGVWPCRDLAAGPEPEPPKASSTRLNRYEDPDHPAIAPSLVVVTFDLPYTLSGVADRHYYGTGLIVDKERGYVLVDRNTVPIAIGDVTITFAGSLEVKGKVEQLHPLHNYRDRLLRPEEHRRHACAAGRHSTPRPCSRETMCGWSVSKVIISSCISRAQCHPSTR